MAVVWWLTLTPLTVWGQTQQQSKEADIRRLMALLGLPRMAKAQMSNGAQLAFLRRLSRERVTDPMRAARMARAFGETFWEEVKESTLAMWVRIWDQRFSHQEIKRLLAFYSGPLARKLVREQPIMLTKSMVSSKVIGQNVFNRLTKDPVFRKQFMSRAARRLGIDPDDMGGGRLYRVEPGRPDWEVEH